MAPTIHRDGPYRFFFYGNEPGEPPHVHVQRDDMLAKFWLEPVLLARSSNSSPRELRRLEGLVRDRAEAFREAWHVHFGL